MPTCRGREVWGVGCEVWGARVRGEGWGVGCEVLGVREGMEKQYERAVTGDHEMPQAERLEHLDNAVQRRHFDDLNRALVHERAASASAQRVTHFALSSSSRLHQPSARKSPDIKQRRIPRNRNVVGEEHPAGVP
jgi:hypothetical protein